MALYPSLEDMKVHQYEQAQVVQEQRENSRRVSETMVYDGQGSMPYPLETPAAQDALASSYPSLMDEYMGLKLEPPSGPLAVANKGAGGGVVSLQNQGQVIQGQTTMIAPITSQSLGLARGNVSHGVREVMACKDGKGKVGMRFRAISNGIFVQFVREGSPAALAGLRFGDQILQINGQNVLGLSHDKAMDLMTKSKDPGKILLAVRDRPFERTITLQRDSTGHVGFQHNGNKITAIAKDTSAARNGLLTDHYFLEVNGQNCIGLKQKEVKRILDEAGQTVTLTIMPEKLYDHMVKCMDMSLLKKQDHSIPEV